MGDLYCRIVRKLECLAMQKMLEAMYAFYCDR